LWLFSFLALFTHVLLDAFTTYGTQLLLPFSDKRISFDSINIVDPVYTIPLLLGGLGSDVAIETADVIIQTDQPSKIAMGIKIGKSTQRIIWQNIALAFGVKVVVLILGALGLATMWAAVFADVGVALLAVLNAVRLQRKEWENPLHSTPGSDRLSYL
ncbi:MAG: metal-dependent hydrolase, partial [Chitinophagales bacterium]